MDARLFETIKGRFEQLLCHFVRGRLAKQPLHRAYENTPFVLARFVFGAGRLNRLSHVANVRRRLHEGLHRLARTRRWRASGQLIPQSRRRNSPQTAPGCIGPCPAPMPSSRSVAANSAVGSRTSGKLDRPASASMKPSRLQKCDVHPSVRRRLERDRALASRPNDRSLCRHLPPPSRRSTGYRQPRDGCALECYR
jgi:hypothetical protein